MTEHNWTYEALCALPQNKPLPWGEDTHGMDPNTLESMLDICAACPVKAECEADARLYETNVNAIFGTRYGQTERTRRKLLRRAAFLRNEERKRASA